MVFINYFKFHTKRISYRKLDIPNCSKTVDGRKQTEEKRNAAR